jgi:hypothetical protein
MQIIVAQSGLYVTPIATTIISTHTYMRQTQPVYVYIWLLICQSPSFKGDPRGILHIFI